MTRHQKRRLRRSITSTDEKRILTIIATWPADSPLCWSALLDVIERDLAHRWTRQGLAKRDAVKAAFQKRTQANRAPSVSKPTATVHTVEEAVRIQSIERLQRELHEAKEKIERLQEKFIVYQYNAMMHGISVEQLGAEMPPIDRGRTDTDAPRSQHHRSKS